VFFIGIIGLSMLRTGIKLFLKQGEVVSFVLNEMNQFFSGTFFPLSILPSYLLFIPKILPSAFLVLLFRETLFANKTLFMPEQYSLFLIALAVNVVLLVIGIIGFNSGINRAKLEGRWLTSG
jgi:uncharacterized phage infection (PIP) family protein YhgE